MKNKILSEKGILVFILCIAFLVRVGAVAVFMYKNNISFSESGITAYPTIDDSQLYYHSAVNLSEGKGYTLTNSETFQYPLGGVEAFRPAPLPNTYYNNHYPPLYSFFLSLLYCLFGTSILVYTVPQILLGTLSCYFVYVIAQKAFSSRVGLLACFLLSIYPPIVWWTSYIRSENLFIPLQLLTIIFLIKAVHNNLDVKNTVFSGILLAMSFLCRNVMLYLPIFVALYFLVVFFKTAKKRLLYGIVTLFLSFYLPLIPWGYRNYTIHDKFFITTVEDWDAFYICNNTLAADAPFFELYEQTYSPNNKYGVDISLPTTEKERACKSFVRQHPLKFIKLCCKRFMAYWGPTTKKPSFFKKATDTFIYILVFPMAFLGFYRSKWWINAGVGYKPIPALLITVILYYTALHSLVSVDDGLIYRYPIIPLIGIFSGFGYYRYFTRN